MSSWSQEDFSVPAEVKAPPTFPFKTGRIPGWHNVSRISVPVEGIKRSWYWNMMTGKTSFSTANGVINYKRKWEGMEGGGLFRCTTCSFLWPVGTDRVTERQDVAWHSCIRWFNNPHSRVRVLQRTGPGFIKGTATSSHVWVQEFCQRDQTSSSRATLHASGQFSVDAE